MAYPISIRTVTKWTFFGKKVQFSNLNETILNKRLLLKATGDMVRIFLPYFFAPHFVTSSPES